MADQSARSTPRYERLEAWRAAHQLALKIYIVTPSLPKSEQFGLGAQMRRSAVSISCNIVEGSMRPGTAEYRRFVGIALASFAELRYQVRLCAELELIPEQVIRELTTLIDQAGRLTWGLFRGLGGSRRRR